MDLFYALVPLVLAVLFIVIIPLCASGRIKNNPIVGIRLPSLRASQEAWERGHRAALPMVYLFSTLSIVSDLVCLLLQTPGVTGPLVAFVFLLAGFLFASIAATRAAR